MVDVATEQVVAVRYQDAPAPLLQRHLQAVVVDDLHQGVAQPGDLLALLDLTNLHDIQSDFSNGGCLVRFAPGPYQIIKSRIKPPISPLVMISCNSNDSMMNFNRISRPSYFVTIVGKRESVDYILLARRNTLAPTHQNLRVDVGANVVQEHVDEVGLVDAPVDELLPQVGLVVLLAEVHRFVDVEQAVSDEEERLAGVAHPRKHEDLRGEKAIAISFASKNIISKERTYSVSTRKQQQSSAQSTFHPSD